MGKSSPFSASSWSGRYMPGVGMPNPGNVETNWRGKRCAQRNFLSNGHWADKYTYTYTYTYTHIHIYTYTHIHIYTYTHIYIYIYIYFNSNNSNSNNTYATYIYIHIVCKPFLQSAGLHPRVPLLHILYVYLRVGVHLDVSDYILQKIW